MKIRLGGVLDSLSETNFSKKQKLLTGIAVCVVGVCVVGATYAYFNVTGTGSVTSPISGGVEKTGTVALEKVDDLNIKLLASDMSKATAGTTGKTYWFTTDANGTGSNYLLDETDTKASANVAKITLSGGDTGVKYACTANLTIAGEDDLAEGVSKIILTGDATNTGHAVTFSGKNTLEIDLATGVTNKQIKIYFTKASSADMVEYITAKAYYKNLTTAQDEVSFTTNVSLTDLSCDTVGEYKITDSVTPLDIITEKKGEGGLSSSLTGDMYRYQGAATDTINNYICIGSDTCQTSVMTTDSYNDHTYRIIGITEYGRMKVIKMGLSNFGDVSGNYWSWNSSGYGAQYDWTNATIRKRLNNINEGYYLASLGSYANYIDSSSNSKFYSTETTTGSEAYIVSGSKTIGDNQTAINLYSLETGDSIASYGADEVDNEGYGYKVGLMQLSDYYLATGDSANCSLSGESYSTCKENWLFLLNNDTRKQFASEWTAARCNSNYAWQIGESGYVYYGWINTDDVVRPVFYLKSDIELKGSGTKESPYYIVTN